jgi:ABC-type lipoprotein release transport system permease subunit
MLNLKLAFRNLFRNGRRTLLTCLLIGFSLSALIIVDGIILGMSKLLVESATHLMSGEAQVHRRGYLDSFDVDLYIADPGALQATLERNPAVAGYSMRVMSGGMVSSPYNVAAAMILGLDAGQEKSVSRISESLVDGEYLSGMDTELIIGSDLADLLEVKLGDRIVLTLSQVDGGGISQELFRLSGISRFGIRELDSTTAFINLDRARGMMGMDTAVHEIAIRYAEGEDSANRNHPLLAELSNSEYEALGWKDFNASIGTMLETIDLVTIVVGMILFLLASFGVINTMFMSIYERIYEFGVIKAIGTRPTDLIKLVLCESFLIAVGSVICGTLLGGAVSYYFSVSGVILGEFEVSGIAFHNNIYSVLEPAQFIEFPIYVILLTVIASLYPAAFAAKIVPSEALQKSL